MDRIEQLLAKSDIHDCLCRYARGVDRSDWALVRSAFFDDATDWHGEFRGGPSEFIDWVSTRHAAIPFSMHFLGQSLVEFLGKDAAFVETYFIAIQRRESADGSTLAMDHEVFGRYVDRFERRGGNWRVAQRCVVYDSTRNQPSTNSLRTLVGALGRRDGGDPVSDTAMKGTVTTN